MNDGIDKFAAGHLGQIETLVNRQRGRRVGHDRILQYGFSDSGAMDLFVP
jgi:hypothetical protein